MENHNEVVKQGHEMQEQKEVQMVDVKISVPKGLNDASDALAHLVKAIMAQLGDGFQVGQDLGPIVAAVIADMGPIANNIALIGQAFKEQPRKSVILAAIALDKALA